MDEQNPKRIEESETSLTIVEGCGCMPSIPHSTEPAEAVEATTPDLSTASLATPTALRPSRAHRSLKIVLSLEAATDGTFHAVLAVGSLETDPQFMAFDVPDIPAAVAAISKLVSDAEAAWDLQPRYPTARPVAKPKGMDKATSPTDGSEPVSPVQPSISNAKSAGSPSPTKSASGQLSLFG